MKKFGIRFSANIDASVKRIWCRSILSLVMTVCFTPAMAQRTTQDYITLDTTNYYRQLPLDSTKVYNQVPKRRTSSRISLRGNIPTSYSVSTNNAVGEIACNSTVSQYGSTELSVKIEGYEDPLGCTPQIALSYSSFRGSGPLGIGWQITGISSISRISKSIYYDGEASGATGSKDDAFSLDGVRLIRTSETSDSICFQTETGRVKAIGYLANGNMSSFKVLYPNGDVADFNHSDVTGFYISSLSSRSSSSAIFNYESRNNHYRITSILYGKNHAGKIEFQYVNNTSDGYPFFYQNGQKISYNYLLSSVISYFNNTELRRYSINYESHGTVRQICSIGCQTGEESLNPLVFYYGETDEITSLESESAQLTHFFSYADPNQLYVTRGKFDYGKDNDALLMFANKIGYFEHEGNPSTIENLYSPNDRLVIATGLYSDLSVGNPQKTADEGFVDAFFVDLDDRSGDEIVKVNHTKSASNEFLQFKVYTHTSVNPVGLKYTRQFSLTGLHNGQLVPKYFFTGDFDGDGRMEIMAVTASSLLGDNIGSQCFVLDLEENRILYSGSPFSYNVVLCRDGSQPINGLQAYNQSDKLLVMDYNGDGKTDIVLIKDTATYVYSFTVGNGVWTCCNVICDYQWRNSQVENRILLVGEFNGDGKHDILASPQTSGSIWYALVSKGNGTFEWKALAITSRDEGSCFFLQDMDLDGQSDLVKKNSNTISIHTIPNLKIGTTYTDSLAVAASAILIPANIQSRNDWYSLLSIREDGSLKKLSLPIDHSVDRLLHGYVSSLGLIKDFRYGKLNGDYSSIYTSKDDAEFPYKNMTCALPVSSNMLSYYQGDTLANVHMHYTNSVVHLQGRGFCGFSQVRAEDLVSGTINRKTYSPYNFQCLKEEEDHLKLNTYKYDVSVAPNRIARIQLRRKNHTDKTNGVQDSTIYAYDSYDNIRETSVYYNDGNHTHIIRNHTNRDGNLDYLLGLVSWETQVSVRDGETFAVSQSKNYTDRGLISYNERSVNGVEILRESYVYNTDNLVSQKIIRKFSSSNTTQNTFSYDSNGHLKTRTDAFGFTDSLFYNNRGLLSRVKDHLGNSVCTYYDEWGRQIKLVHPDQTIDSTAYEWGTGVTNLSVTSLRKIKTGKPALLTTYDIFGKEIRKQEETFDGSWLTTDMSYDHRQRLSGMSYPHKGANANSWMTYSYDNFDRLISQVYADGTEDQYSYSGLTKTVTKKGQTSTYTYNSLGDVLSVEDAGGIITYKYNGEGKPLEIKAPGNIITRITYDSCGRRTSLSDPSAGISTIEYVNGNISRSVDARGKETRYTYDLYDRITSKQLVGDFTTTYTYDSNNHLVSKAASNGTSTTYTYDQYERVASQIRNSLDGIWLRQDYTYADGNVSAISYSCQSGNISTEHYEYAHGQLRRVTNNNSPVYNKVSENDQGIETKFRTGAISHVLAYDNEGRLTSHSGACFGNTLMDFSYVYNIQTGNLIARTDEQRNLTENFSYDHLSRLTQFGNQTTAYDEKGNIVNRSLAGEYTYDSSRPYAVSGIDYDVSQMSSESQDLTFNALGRVATLSQGEKEATFFYDNEGERTKMVYVNSEQDTLSYTKHYVGSKYEVDSLRNTTREILYIGGDAYSALAAYVRTDGGTWTLYHICRDYQGSIMAVVKQNGLVVQRLSYDAWGNLRNPDTYEVYGVGEEPELFLGRGYTGHEHLQEFGLINMNARLYDPIIGRFISPDNYVQQPWNSQVFNRYSYCQNNPLMFTDPDGEFFIFAAIGAAIGTYFGGVLANGSYNPTKWDFGSAKTWGYMFCGGIVGAASGYVGAAISSSGLVGSNTLGIMTSSFINSVGTNIYTKGATPISISAGVISYDFTNGEFGFLCKKGNSSFENIGYCFGALANITDMISIIRGGGENIYVNSAKTKDGHEWWGHSSATKEDGNTIVSVGPSSGVEKVDNLSQTWKNSIQEANVNWNSYFGEKGTWTVGLNNVSTTAMSKYALGITRWDLLLNSCVGHVTRALWHAGVPTIYAFHPHMLNLQLSIRQLGLILSPYIYQIP